MAASAPAELIESDFIVLKEDYSRYHLHDGTVLKVKIAVKKILRTPIMTAQGYPGNLGMDAVNIVSALVQAANKRPPTKEPWDAARDVGTEIKFEPLEEKWQEYMTTDGFKVLVKPVVVKVFKYDKYNSFGEPIYSATIQAITNIEKIVATAP